METFYSINMFIYQQKLYKELIANYIVNVAKEI